MEYNGRYRVFDLSRIKAYPVSDRDNKTQVSDLITPDDVADVTPNICPETCAQIDAIAEAVVGAGKNGRPVVLFTGAHLVKNGLSGLLVDLIRRGTITLVAGNGATAIHDFELALIGATSEYVPQALETGQFGMAYEFCYQNLALELGNQYKLGYGESLGKMICEESFRSEVLALTAPEGTPRNFAHPDISMLATCYQTGIPFTVHVGIGADVIDQHASFNGQAKGGCSGRDFLIYADQISRFVQGGVVLNIGSAVTGPEVFLKAASMAGNIGKAPQGIITADFDIREHAPDDMTDESSPGYYCRDQKSIVTRVPQAFGGKGYYVAGDQKQTFPLLYQKVIERL